MTCRLLAVSFESADPVQLARFWGALLRWPLTRNSHDVAELVPGNGVGFGFQFRAEQEEKSGQNERHLHLTSESVEDQRHTVANALELGAHRIDIGQRPEEGHVVLADPEGNEFCVIEADNEYLADCGFMAEITCAGSREVGFFWREALEWRMVWDEGLQTAVQSPDGGPKVSWDGEGMPPVWQSRLRPVLAPPSHGDQRAEAARLVSLGAARLGYSQVDPSTLVMADPDGREFYLLDAR